MIPGVRTFHPREAWVDPRYPVFGPDSPGVYIDFVGHYPGTGDVPDQDYRGHVYVDPVRFRNDLFGYYRQMNRSYWEQRDYAVGYQFGIDYLGGVTELRGFDYRNAANSGGKLPGNWNHRSGSAQFVVDLDQPATDLALYSFAMIVAYLRRQGHSAHVKRHDDGEWTSCPGAVGAQLSAGMGNPEYWVRRGPPPGAAPLPDYLNPQPPDDEDDMAAYIAVPPPERKGKPHLYVSSSVRPATTFDYDDGVPARKMEAIPAVYRVQQYDNLHRAAGLG